jgi:hypothetical protein
MAVTMVCSAWLGEVSITGGNEDWRSQGVGIDESRRGKRGNGAISLSRVLIGLSDLPRHVVEHGEVDSTKRKTSTASCWPACGRKGMRTTLP